MQRHTCQPSTVLLKHSAWLRASTVLNYAARMSRTDPQVNFRMPAELREKLDRAAKDNKRTLSAEIVARLEASFHVPVAPSGTLRLTPSLLAEATKGGAPQDALSAANIDIDELLGNSKIEKAMKQIDEMLNGSRFEQALRDLDKKMNALSHAAETITALSGVLSPERIKELTGESAVGKYVRQEQEAREAIERFAEPKLHGAIARAVDLESASRAALEANAERLSRPSKKSTTKRPARTPKK